MHLLTSDKIIRGIKAISQNILDVSRWTIVNHLQTSSLSSNKVNKMTIPFIKA